VFMTQPKFLKMRSNYWSAISPILNAMDNPKLFFDFIQRFFQTFEQLKNVTNVDDNNKEQIMVSLIGVCRDLRGVCLKTRGKQ
jgi:hypothetical protein